MDSNNAESWTIFNIAPGKILWKHLNTDFKNIKNKKGTAHLKRLTKQLKRKSQLSTQNKLCVGGVSLRLQGSYEHIDEPKPQGQERDGLIMGPPILLIEFPFQQNLKTHINVVKSTMSCFQNFSIRIYINQKRIWDFKWN